MRPSQSLTFCLTRWRNGKLSVLKYKINKRKRNVLCTGDKSFVTKVKEQLEANILVLIQNHKEMVEKEAPKCHTVLATDDEQLHSVESSYFAANDLTQIGREQVNLRINTSSTSNGYFSTSGSEVHGYEIDTSCSNVIQQIEKVDENQKNTATSEVDTDDHLQTAMTKEMENVICEVDINQHPKQIEAEQFQQKTDFIFDTNNKAMFLSAIDNIGHLIPTEPLLPNIDSNEQLTQVEKEMMNCPINMSPTSDERLRSPEVDTNGHHLYNMLCSEAFQQIENVVGSQEIENTSTSEANHLQNAMAKEIEFVIGEVEISQDSEQIETEQFQQKTDLILDKHSKDMFLSAIDNNGHLLRMESLLSETDSNEQLKQVEKEKVTNPINTSTTSDERLQASEVETNGHHSYILCTEAFQQIEKVVEPEIDKNTSTTETETIDHLQNAKMKDIECHMDTLFCGVERNQHSEQIENHKVKQKNNLTFSNGNIDQPLMSLDTINNSSHIVFSTVDNANHSEHTGINKNKMQTRKNKKAAVYTFSDTEESVGDPYSDVELTEEEFVPDATASSSDSISSDYSVEENDDINREQCKDSTLTNQIKNVRRRLFQDIIHSDMEESTKLETSTTSLAVSQKESRSRKLLPDKNPKSSKIETVANFERKDATITMSVVRPLHEGVYTGRYLLPDTNDEIVAGIILSNNSRRKHICKFEAGKTFACTLHRNAINKCTLHMDQCMKSGSLLRGTELKIPGSDSTLTGLSIVEEEAPVTKTISLNLKLKKSKQHCCFYCGELNTAIARHLVTKHKNEEEVQKILRLKSGSKEKDNLLTRLRLQGDHKYNEKIDKLDPTMRIAVKNPHKHSVFDNRYCYKCEGSYGKRNFARHYRKCTGKPPTYERIIDKSVSQNKNKNAFDDLIEALKMDNIGEEVMNDEAIILLAKHYATSSNPLGHRINNNRSNLRRLARLCLIVKKLDPNISCFRESLVPKRYDTLMQGIRELCQFENGAEGAEKPKLALQYGPIITKTIKCLLIKELKEKGNETHPNIVALKQMLEIHRFDFANQVTKKALILSQLRKSQKNYALPSPTDLEKFTAHLAKTSEISSNHLSQYGFDFQHWRRLGESLLCQIVLFNRRRVGEASRIKIDDYIKRKKIDQKDYQHLSRLQIILAKRYSVMYIIGKRIRLLPVLLNSCQEKQIDVFLRYRSSAGVDEKNQFLFGYPVKEGHLNASRLLPRYSLESGVEQPELLRGTILRRQVATASQFLNLSDNEIQELSDFMGHDTSVHRNHYRQHTLTLEVTKIARYLSVIGDTDIQKHRGKTLDELEPYIPPEDFDNDDIYEDDDLEVNDHNFRELAQNSVNNDIYNEDPVNRPDVSDNTTEDNLNATETSEIILQEPTDGLELPEVTSLEEPSTSKSPNTSKSPIRTLSIGRGKCQEKAGQKSSTPKRHTVKELLYLVDKQGSPKMFREKRRNVLHRASWSLKEKEFIKSKFGFYLNPENPLPSKDLIKKVLASNANQLKPTRTADNTYAFIQNQRKKKNRAC